jgi:toxin ParE1/3/4
VPEPRRIVLARCARRDIFEVLTWSREQFGEQAAKRYDRLLKQSIRDIAQDPGRPTSRARPELGPDVRAYHLSNSRGRWRSEFGVTKRPRHFLIYRCRKDGALELLRVLHDSRDFDGPLSPE